MAVLATSKEQKTAIETHPVKDYVRDERVNRFMSPARVEKLRANLNLEAIGVLTVSKRKGGELIILDGAHRTTALTEEGFEDLKVPANVHHHLTQAEEAALFLLYNDRLAVDILERFRLQVAAEDPEALVLDREIRDAGFLPATGYRNHLTAIKTLQTIYRGGSSTGRETHLKTLRDMLRIIVEAWGTEGTATKQTMLGIGALLLDHGDDVDQGHLVEALATLRGGANAIVVKTHYHAQEGGKRAIQAAELAVIEVYNKSLKAADKIKSAS
jgi:hypothetical protein